MADCFLDTNILLYAVNTHEGETEKTNAARTLVQTTAWAWSAQVAAEFVRASTSQRQVKPLTRAQARQWVELWMAFPMQPIDGALVLQATRVGERFSISHFDAQIIAAAQRLNCAIVYSEDLNSGQEYDGVRVMNPFLSET